MQIEVSQLVQWRLHQNQALLNLTLLWSMTMISDLKALIVAGKGMSFTSAF